MRLKTMIFGAGIGALLSAAPASAQTQPQVVTQFDDATIARLLLNVQAAWQVEPGANGRSIYRANAEGGIVFTAMPRACDEQKMCRALMVLTPFTRNDRRNLASLDAFISAFNDQNPSAKAYRTGDGTVVLQSYVNAAGGTSFANARAQLLVFGQNIVKLRAGLEQFAEGR
ncbi:MAG: YbjN domain-containing protein [Erythrobacter sp.]